MGRVFERNERHQAQLNLADEYILLAFITHNSAYMQGFRGSNLQQQVAFPLEGLGWNC